MIKMHKSNFFITRFDNNIFDNNIFDNNIMVAKIVKGLIADSKNYGIDKRYNKYYQVTELTSGMGLRSFMKLKEAKEYIENKADEEVQKALTYKKNLTNFLKAKDFILNEKIRLIKSGEILIVYNKTWNNIIINNMELIENYK